MKDLYLFVFFTLLFTTQLSSQVQMSEKNLISRSTAEVGVGDFNHDGHPDIAISNSNQRWYAGPDFVDFYDIGSSTGGPYAARVADINGDGWDDLVTSDGARNEADIPGHIYAYINPADSAASHQPWERITVYSGNVRHQNDMRLVDMDGDGLLDIIERTWSSERVVVALQNPDITNWTVRVFDTGETAKPEGISAGDVDGDMENEIILSGVYWDNPGGWRTGDPIEYLIDAQFIQEEVKSEVGDIDNDGDNDVYMGSAEGAAIYIAWYENDSIRSDGSVAFTKHIIKDDFGKCHMVQLIDFDLDGDLDLCTGKSFGETGCLIYLNEGNGTSWTEIDYDPSGSLYTGIVADLDADGDYDIVGPYKFNGVVYYYLNETPGSPPGPPHNVQTELIDGLNVQLTWSDTISNEGLFEIERYTDEWSNIGTVLANDTSYLDETTDPGETYIYRVRAANGAGFSSYAESDSIETWTAHFGVSISPASGYYIDPPTLTLATDSLLGDIRYTLDGSTPDENSPIYIVPFILDSTAVVSAFQTGNQFLDSEITSSEFFISENGNFPPEANAGNDQDNVMSDSIALSGVLTTDFDDPLSELVFTWSQLAGPSGTFTNADSISTLFISEEEGVFIFELSVQDEASTSVDTVEVSKNDLDECLIAYWPLNESTGTTGTELVDGNNATIYSGASWDATGGMIDGALEFDGVNGRAEAPIINIDTNEMTISLWVKVPDFSNVEGRFVSKASSINGNDHIWMLSQISGSALRFRLNTVGNNTTTLASSTGQLVIEEWAHVVGTYDNSFMRIYKNGVEIASVAQTGDIDTSSDKIGIGNQPLGSGDRPFKGSLDDIRIYNKALTEEEIILLYNNTCSNYRLLENMLIEEDMSIYAKQLIELNNVTVKAPYTLQLFAPKVEAAVSCVVENTANLMIVHQLNCGN